MMKILDVRGNLVKIESSKPVHLSSMLKVADDSNIYIAQVLYVETGNTCHIVFAKLLAVFDAPWVPVNIQTVSKDAVCEVIETSEIISKLGANRDIIIGELAIEQNKLISDKEFFDKKILIVSEKDVDSNLLISNFAYQIKNLGYNTLVFDTSGSLDGIKLTAGIDFKLPLNEHAIGFIFDKYFSDITDESRAMVSSIFTELRAYASTVPYIPFNSFKSVIDNVFDYSQNLGLFFFKTKLEKLCDASIFANSHDEVMDWTSLSEFGPGTIIIDLSHVNKMFVREYISLVLNSFKGTDNKLYAFAKLSDMAADNDFIQELIENNNVITSCIVPSDFKFISALKQNSGSLIVFGGIKKPDNFDYCKFLLKNLSSDKYILSGSMTAPYSLIFQLKEIMEVVPKVNNVQDNTEQSEVNSQVESYNIENDVVISGEGTVTETAQAEELQNNEEENNEHISVMEPLLEQNSEYEPLPELKTEDDQQVIEDYNPEALSLTEEDVSDSLKDASVSPEPEYSGSVSIQQPTDAIPEENFDKPLEEIQELVPNNESEEDTELELIAPILPDEEYETAGDELEEEGIAGDEVFEPVDVSALETEHSEQIAGMVDDETAAMSVNYETEDTAIIVDNLDIVETESPIEQNVELEAELNLDDADGLELSDDVVGFEEELVLEEPDLLMAEELEISSDIPELDEVNDDFSYQEAERQYSDDSVLELKFENEELNADMRAADNAVLEESESQFETIENQEEERTPEEILDEEIRRDVDKVYMTPLHQETDELSEEDLDFIEELVGADELQIEEDNSEDDIELVQDEEPVVQHSDLLPEEETEEKLSEVKPEDDGAILQQKNTATPAVPIYAAEIPEDVIVHSDPIQQGDRVMHVKFGVGVVEKIFSYGTKNFCSINFENIGRKVLDPNITELKKA